MNDGMTPLPMADTGGGCACCSVPTTTTLDSQAPKETAVNTQTFPVTGMTCGHCVSAVTEELRQIPGVTDVTVDLVAGGTSAVTVSSEQPVGESVVAAALDEAGDYQLVGN